MRRDAALEGLVHIHRAAAVAAELLELVVGHAGEKYFRETVAINIVAGNAHAPDLQTLPTLFGGVSGGWLARLDFPELFLPAFVVLAVIAHPQGRLAAAVPIREQHGQRAVAWGQRLGRSKAPACGVGAQQYAGRASAPGKVRAAAVVVGAESQGGPGLAAFPGGGKRGVPIVARRDIPAFIGALELAATQAAKDLVFAHAQHDEIHLAVAVNVQRIGAGGVGQLQARALLLQFEGAAARAAVAVELGFVDATRDIDFGQAIVIAVEHGHAAADHEFVFAFKAALQAGRLAFLNKTRNRWACCRVTPARRRAVQQQNCQQHARTVAHSGWRFR